MGEMKTISPFFLVFFLTVSQVIDAKLISKVAGAVGSKYLTSREVLISSHMEAALYGEAKALNISVGKLKLDTPEYYKEVNNTLLEWMVSLEAELFAVSNVTDDSLTKSQNTVTKKLAKASAWTELKPTYSEIQGLLKRKVLAKQFIRFKIDSSYVPVSDTEAEDYFKQNKKSYTDFDYSAKKDEIKTLMSRKKVDERLQDWFNVLQKKYRVRNLSQAN